MFRLALSVILVCGASAKLTLESAARDHEGTQALHSVLIQPDLLASRALENPAAEDRGRSVFEELVRMNAASANRWADLGAMYLEGGDIGMARHCYITAAGLALNSAGTAINVANFYIKTNETRKALPYLGQILGSASEYDDIVFDNFDTLHLNFVDILSYDGLPANAGVTERYFRHVLQVKDYDNARMAWQWLESRAPGDKLADEYINFLLAHGDVADAANVWQSHLAARGAGAEPGGFIVNGGFEREPAETIFGWRIDPHDDVQVNRDTQITLSDSASLHVEFDGKQNVAYQGISQRIFLPSGRYRFEAFVRTTGITTDEGVGFRVIDVRSSQTLTETSRLTGTQDWQKLEGQFAIDSPVRLVEIQFVRRQSLRFDSLIAGSAWIDQVSLKKVG